MVGAFLAFYFGFKLYKKQKREENKSYLHYTTSALCYLNNQLYIFKKQIAVTRYNEARSLKEQIERGPPNGNVLNLQFRETANYIYGADFELAIDMEKLEFLVSRDPNMIILLGTLISSVKSLNHVVKDINSEMSEYARQIESLNMPRIMLMLQKNQLLYEQLDSTLYLNEKFMDLLIKFGVLEYGKKMKIKSSAVIGKEYEQLKPAPIESWEDNYEWFPKKKSLWSKCCLKVKSVLK